MAEQVRNQVNNASESCRMSLHLKQQMSFTRDFGSEVGRYGCLTKPIDWAEAGPSGPSAPSSV